MFAKMAGRADQAVRNAYERLAQAKEVVDQGLTVQQYVGRLFAHAEKREEEAKTDGEPIPPGMGLTQAEKDAVTLRDGYKVGVPTATIYAHEQTNSGTTRTTFGGTTTTTVAKRAAAAANAVGAAAAIVPAPIREATAVPQQIAPQQPAGGVNTLQRMMDVRAKASPKPTTERRDPASFLVAPASTAAASPAAADDAQDSEAARGAGFAPNKTMLAVDVNKLDKLEAISFCKLLNISYQGKKEELVERALNEIKRRNTVAQTNPLEGPVFQAALATFARQSSQGDFK
jgi:hypothetical protein